MFLNQLPQILKMLMLKTKVLLIRLKCKNAIKKANKLMGQKG